MKKWFRFREVKIATIVVFFNIELVVIPLILKWLLGLQGMALKLSAGLWSTGELSFWYWFSGWVLKKMRESDLVKEAVSIGRSVNKEELVEVKNTTLVQRLDDWLYDHIIGNFDPKKHSRRKLFRFLKGLGYAVGPPVTFAVSLLPVVWIVPFTICRWTNWKSGMVAVFAANFLRNVEFAEIWDRLWTLF